jgi:hypothetical protein
VNDRIQLIVEATWVRILTIRLSILSPSIFNRTHSCRLPDDLTGAKDRLWNSGDTIDEANAYA